MTEPVRAAFEALHGDDPRVPDAKQRIRHIRAVGDALKAAADDVVAAVSADFRHRPEAETLLAEVGVVVSNARWSARRIRRWCRPRRVLLPPEFWPSTARIERVPLGVVGIIAPWNYPVQLALVPLIAALAGGNRVILKPSEHTPRTSALLADIVGRAVPKTWVRVIEGGVDTARTLTSLPLDGLFYTGSTAIGRKVMAAAAENLVPVTLELGGKSPAIVLPDADLDQTAASIMAGKLLNAGQTCVAPDYALVPRGRMAEVMRTLRAATARLYPDPSGPDYAAIARDADIARLEGLIEGTGAEPLMQPMPPPPRMGAWAVPDPDPEGPLMQDEIFGPILPVVPYDTVADAVAFANARPCPLALYVYGADTGACRAVVAATRSGGAMINDCVVHVAVDALPFGGAGASGLGTYHGDEGFRTFTRPRSVLVRHRRAVVGLARPPYGPRTQRIINYLLR